MSGWARFLRWHRRQMAFERQKWVQDAEGEAARRRAMVAQVESRRARKKASAS